MLMKELKIESEYSKKTQLNFSETNTNWNKASVKSAFTSLQEYLIIMAALLFLGEQVLAMTSLWYLLFGFY